MRREVMWSKGRQYVIQYSKIKYDIRHYHNVYGTLECLSLQAVGSHYIHCTLLSTPPAFKQLAPTQSVNILLHQHIYYTNIPYVDIINEVGSHTHTEHITHKTHRNTTQHTTPHHTTHRTHHTNRMFSIKQR